MERLEIAPPSGANWPPDGRPDRRAAPSHSRSTLNFPEGLLERSRSAGRLGALLAWSVVYADIGTSIYYVPGLLFGELEDERRRRRRRSCWGRGWP
jgi:hypothetical protein